MDTKQAIITAETPARLILLEEGCRAIAEAKSIKEVKGIRDTAQLMVHYVRERDLGVQAANDAAEMKIRAERRMGELLTAMPKSVGGQPYQSTGNIMLPVDLPTTLGDLGITKNESSRCQTIAALPEKAFEEKVADARDKGELTTSAVLKVAKKHKRESERKEQAKAASAKPAKSGKKNWVVVVGDCLDEIPRLKESPRLIFADPPYNIGYDYGDGPEDDLMGYDEYVEWAESWVEACANALSEDGSLWVLASYEYAAEYAIAIKKSQLTIRNWITWYEGFGVNCANKFNRTSRALIYAVKDPKRFVFDAETVKRPSDRQTKYDDARADPSGKILDDVWFDIPRLAGTHKERIPTFPTQLPITLPSRVIACSSEAGDLVVDPFNGSATTGVAALRLGRRYIGIEKRETFAQLAIERLKGES